MSAEKRPVLKLQLSFVDKGLEALGLLLLLTGWTYLVLAYSKLPESIPTHFSISGKPNAFGHKSDLYNLMTVATALYLLLTIANLFPQYFNYLRSITAENARRQYTIATRILRYLKVMIVFIFVALVWITARY
ncbi:DUF1648 domain-containing protein [Pedobacter steynii]|uniref:DUF1648 domain-containing protein n=1 Tax=Pedobacter steynii TaxID=430522 RepID=A0A1D7QDV6_9SPHI|nr:DUF1648 domain-containing protein [Pedobacter steynii]AOM76861.1 hypothetical protein BFS30_06580 [Pedobacter steynii]